MVDESARKRELVSQLAAARTRVSGNAQNLKRSLDFPERFRQAFARNTLVWLGGATGTGALLALMPARKKKIYVSDGKKLKGGGMLLTTVKLISALAKPALTAYVTKKIAGMAEKVERVDTRTHKIERKV